LDDECQLNAKMPMLWTLMGLGEVRRGHVKFIIGSGTINGARQMESNKRSRTAELTAMLRALHFLHGERPLILEDPIAIELLDSDLREYCLGSSTQNDLAVSGGAAVVLGRARLTEDKLAEAVRAGIDQYVVLGAGGDSFAFRRPDLMEVVRVYEIDQPATQDWKRECLNRSGRQIPASLEFVPADLEHETVLDALGRSSFRNERPAFLSWLGTIMYLTPEAVFRTLSSLAENLAPGSEIVFDYRVQIEFVDPAEVESVLAGDKGTAAMGEPKRSFFNPHTFTEEIESKARFEMLENLSPGELTDRYFTGRSDGMRPTTHHWYAHLRLRG